jgi:hypothetical protein
MVAIRRSYLIEAATATGRIQRQHLPSILASRQNRYNLTSCFAQSWRADKQDKVHMTSFAYKPPGLSQN